MFGASALKSNGPGGYFRQSSALAGEDRKSINTATEKYFMTTGGFYSVQDDVVTMLDETGKPTGKRQQLGAGEDPRQVAYRLICEAWKARAPDFWRSLKYRPLGVA
jgi:hypothetical protein